MSAFVIAARRTAVVPRGGAFRGLGLTDLAVPVILACLRDAEIGLNEVTEVIVSNALGAGGNPARLIALASGMPQSVAGLTVDRQCVGGLDALLLARAMVVSDMADVVVAGGVESYSRRPLRLAVPIDGGPPVAYDRPAFTPWPDRDPDMHVAADVLGQRLGIDRAAQDHWAVSSHAKARAAGAPPGIVVLQGQDRDAFARHLTPEIASRAKVLAGTVTTANAAVAADAAAFVVVVSQARAARARRAMRFGGITLGAQPDDPGWAPVAATRQVLHQAGLTPSDLHHTQIMEAYAVQALACIQGAGLDPARVNPCGGALARGHPIGASGAVLAVDMFHHLRHGYALAAIAAAGGIGTAVLGQAMA